MKNSKNKLLLFHILKSCTPPCALCLSLCILLTLTACSASSQADGSATDSANSKYAADSSDNASSLANADDGMERAEIDDGKETTFAPGLTEDQPQPFSLSSDHIYQMGEAVAAIDVQNGTIVNDALVYTFTKATLYDDFAQAGLDESTLSAYTGAEAAYMQDENGQLKESVKLLLLELTVQNACAEPERNISSLSVRCITSMNESEGSVKGQLLELSPSEIAYFSNPSGKKVGEDWKEYAYYTLPVGQSKNLTVGWLVDTEQYDPDHLYISLDYDEDQKLIQLDVSDAQP